MVCFRSLIYLLVLNSVQFVLCWFVRVRFFKDKFHSISVRFGSFCKEIFSSKNAEHSKNAQFFQKTVGKRSVLFFLTFDIVGGWFVRVRFGTFKIGWFSVRLCNELNRKTNVHLQLCTMYILFNLWFLWSFGDFLFNYPRIMPFSCE